jgi:hypothetical protein
MVQDSVQVGVRWKTFMRAPEIAPVVKTLGERPVAKP